MRFILCLFVLFAIAFNAMADASSVRARIAIAAAIQAVADDKPVAPAPQTRPIVNTVKKMVQICTPNGCKFVQVEEPTQATSVVTYTNNKSQEQYTAPATQTAEPPLVQAASTRQGLFHRRAERRAARSSKCCGN